MHTLARICVQRPVFATVLSLTLVVVGLVGYAGLGVDRFPKVEFPFVVVSTSLPGSSPEEIETEITDKIERQVNTIGGIENLQSTSSDGLSVVTIQFSLSKDANVAAEEVRAKVALAKGDIPPDANDPVVQKFDIGATPVISYIISAPGSLRNTYEYVDKVVRRRLESVSGAGEVQVIGGRERQINVFLDPYKLRAYGISPSDVSGALNKQNAQVPGGVVEQGDSQLTLRTRGRVASVEQFGDLPVKNTGAMQVYVRDVARVEDGESRAKSLASIGGKEAVVLNVIKQSDANAVAVISAVKERMAAITLPPGYKISIYRDQSIYINASLRAVREHLILGALLAALVVFIFLNTAGMTKGAWFGIVVCAGFVLFMTERFGILGALVAAILIFLLLMFVQSARPTVIAAMAIPTSIIATFMLMKVLGFTQNNVTLLALTLSVGVVIDDAIVVLENVFRVVEEEGLPPYQAAIKATREIGLAVLAITMSLVMVFLPVAFMSGIVGRFLNSFGMTMACAICVSLFVSFTLTPMLCSRWLRATHDGGEDGAHDQASAGGSGGQGSKGGWFGRVEDGYALLLHWSIRHWYFILLACAVTLFSIVPLGGMARKNFLPDDDESQFQVYVRAAEGTSLEGTRRVLEQIAEQAQKLPEVRMVVVTVGEDNQHSANVGSVFIRMNEVEDRKDKTVTQETTMTAARKQVLPQFDGRGLIMSVQKVGGFGGGSNAAIQMAIAGPDLTKLTELSSRLVTAVRKIPGVADADSTLIGGKPELQATIDRNRAANMGVDVQAVAQALRLAVAGDDKITAFDDRGEQYEVHIRLDEQFRRDAIDLSLLSVPNEIDGQRGTVTLDQVVVFQQTTSAASIERYNRQRQFQLRVNLLPGTSQGTVSTAIENEIKKLDMPAGYGKNDIGQSREFKRTFSNFATAGLLSFIFMYMVIAAQFESFIQALVIMFTLPLTFPFAVLSIVITGDSLNIFSMLGMLVLLGVVKKNAILQIDRANQLRAAGMDLVSATVQASRDRLRPIIMTTLAFVAGMIPLVLSQGTGAATNKSTGGVIVGGQIFSLALTLVAAPVLYVLFDSVQDSRFCRYVRRRVFKSEDGARKAMPVWNEDEDE
ncbi:MAG: efflux RND transporter permease subunit [Armatimonadetes bacterium]|nr:efflux RND transporter permease subunit [Armatimonadota bacterium]